MSQVELKYHMSGSYNVYVNDFVEGFIDKVPEKENYALWLLPDENYGFKSWEECLGFLVRRYWFRRFE